MDRRREDTRHGGFTFVELVISMGICVILAVTGASLMVKTTSYFTESVVRSDLMESAKVAQERVFDQLYSARIISLQWTTATRPMLTFVVHLELPVAGGGVDWVDSTGKVNWGAVEPTGPKLDVVGSVHRVTITVASSGTATENESKLDINQDGDQLDSFETGSLVMRTTEGTDSNFLPGRLVLGVGGNGSTDIDGDNVADPLFQVVGETFPDANKSGIFDDGEAFIDANGNGRWDGALAVNLLVTTRDRDGQGHRFVYKASIKLTENP
jgi:type II secretory pathway pseudopilin PulG